MNQKSVFLNVEIKAKCNDLEKIRQILQSYKAVAQGIDHQTDTYFNVNNGRLKLREGNIENNLIGYDRANQTGPKSSQFQLLKVGDPLTLKEMLSNHLGVKMVVKKDREIYFVDNVKIHLDWLPELGSFVEIEASNLYADLSEEKLLQQCKHFIEEFEIREEDLIKDSYSDMMLQLRNPSV